VEKQKDKVPPCTLGLRKKIKSFYGGSVFHRYGIGLRGMIKMMLFGIGLMHVLSHYFPL
jgi:hypothetical protein